MALTMKLHKRAVALLALSFLFGTVAAVAASLHAGEAVLDLDAARTKVAFTLSDVLHTVHGDFKLKSGSIRFDAVTGQAGGAFVIDAATGQSGSGGRDRRMHKNILESDKFPEITFAPDRFQGHLAPEGDSEIELHGLFRIHGEAHEMTLKTTVHVAGDLITATTHFAVHYVEWGMKNPSTLFLRVGDKVDIDLQAAGRIRAAQ
jgi:polyisoprenoid-binding protein YceI